MLFSLLWAAIGFIAIAAQAAVSYLRKPGWVSQDVALDRNWRRLAAYSFMAALAAMSVSLVLSFDNLLHYYAMPAVGVTTYLVFQSFFTDLSLRYVDRWPMRVANLVALGTGVYILAVYGVQSEFVIFTIFAILAFGIGFMPGVGDSDGRALQLLVYGLFPIYGVHGLQWAFMGILGSLLLYFVGYSIYRRSFTIKGLLSKLSFPMVPLILTPVLLVLLFGRFLPILG